jgi:hypothetical protein
VLASGSGHRAPWLLGPQREGEEEQQEQQEDEDDAALLQDMLLEGHRPWPSTSPSASPSTRPGLQAPPGPSSSSGPAAAGGSQLAAQVLSQGRAQRQGGGDSMRNPLSYSVDLASSSASRRAVGFSEATALQREQEQSRQVHLPGSSGAEEEGGSGSMVSGGFPGPAQEGSGCSLQEASTGSGEVCSDGEGEEEGGEEGGEEGEDSDDPWRRLQSQYKLQDSGRASGGVHAAHHSSGGRAGGQQQQQHGRHRQLPVEAQRHQLQAEELVLEDGDEGVRVVPVGRRSCFAPAGQPAARRPPACPPYLT